MEDKKFSLNIKLIENYLFQIDFGEFGNFMTDEPEPLGGGEGPNPSRMLAASVGNCLAASLLFASRKYGDDPGEISASVEGSITRVDNRWRITNINVHLQVDGNTDQLPNIQKALNQFEDFCVVTQSVRSGIDVDVTVMDRSGNKLM
ncbi:MAG: OsmC family protein [Cellvibrionaceae bacterium]